MCRCLIHKDFFMRKFACALLAAASLSLCALPCAYSEDLSPEQRAQIEQVVHDYILAHPEILVQAAQALDAQNKERAEQMLAQMVEEITKDPAVPVRGGSDQSTHYMIEFSDYNCGYCKIIRPYTRKLSEEHDVKIYYLELPILSEQSLEAAVVGLTLFNEDPDKYFAYQDYLMDAKQKLESNEDIRKALEAVGADYDALRQKARDSGEAQKSIGMNIARAQRLGVTGTPFFIIDGKVLRGAVKDYATLEAYLD